MIDTSAYSVCTYISNYIHRNKTFDSENLSLIKICYPQLARGKEISHAENLVKIKKTVDLFTYNICS